jgi:histidinol-phosphatase (PHP family)
MKKTASVSIHGGHSGQFCSHAADTLDEIVQCYIRKQFPWVGITEHAPFISENSLYYPDEREVGLTPKLILQRFDDYMLECRRLQKKYRNKIRLFSAMEIETYSGYEQFVPYLIDRFQPDYIVGSVHFINDIGFDYSESFYNQIVETVGGKDKLYCLYFDKQYEMIKILKPSVVGHFDLIRIFDRNYKSRLLNPDIWQRIERNLQLIKDLDLIMDFNLRSLYKGAEEPYISRPILKRVRELNIAVVPGDDSHDISSVGNYLTEAIKILKDFRFDTNWRQPKLLQY